MNADRRSYLMGRKWFFGSIGVVGAGLLASCMLFTLLARQSLIFNWAFLRTLPAVSSTGENTLSAPEILMQVIAFPVSKYSSAIAGQRYEVPLPPHTIHHPDRDRSQLCPKRDCLYTSFATPEQFQAYYTITLPKAGWKYSDRMGDGHLFTNNTINSIQLLIVDRPIYHQEMKISELAVSIYENRKLQQ